MLKDYYTVHDVAEELQDHKVFNKWVITAENFKKLIEGKESNDPTG